MIEVSDFQITVTSPEILPLGFELTSFIAPLAHVSFSYDYSLFDDPNAPAFEFQADMLNPDGTIERGVTCISNPGRHSTRKED